MQKFNLSKIEDIINYKFKNPILLKQAFTHSSFANEHRIRSNERLEFLGDSVLSVIISEQLYSLTKKPEGELSKIRSKIVSEKPLAALCEVYGLDKFLLRGTGETKNNLITRAMQADLIESIIGAIYIDSGFESAKNFIYLFFCPLLNSVLESDAIEDFKSYLQEHFSKDKIKYKTSKFGEAHKPIFISRVYINGVASGKGQSTSKREAEQLAAGEAVQNIKKV